MSQSSARQAFLEGVQAMLPILLGVAPFGMIFGALAIATGIPPLEAQGFSWFVFAGSAQFIAAGLIGDGIHPVIIVLTIFVVNLRHLLYSASIAPYTQRLPTRWKIVLAWLLTDEAFAIASIRYRREDPSHNHWFTLGTGLTLWVPWQISTMLGITLGSYIPESWSLDFALPLTFMALLTPTLTDRPAWAAAASAGLISVALAGLPYKLGLLLAVLFGVAAGLIVDKVKVGTAG